MDVVIQGFNLARPLLVAVATFLLFAAAGPSQAARAKPAREFRDCPSCPLMVPLPRGSFLMGSPAGEAGRTANEGPQQRVTFARTVVIAKRETSFAEWDACVADGGCRAGVSDEGRGRGDLPVVNVTWFDARDYAAWLSRKTGKIYRLPTEAEWEYGARAGATAQYSWGAQASHELANYGRDECCGGHTAGRDRWLASAPVGSFPANAFGLQDMHGNVWEWTIDCWAESHEGLPEDGSARTDGNCNLHPMRGGSFGSLPVKIRAAHRDGYPPADQGHFIGFRVARAEN